MKRSSTTTTPTIHRKGGQALGSSNYLSDVLGEAYQHVEYLPWGETFLEERNTQTDRNTYLYTGKELDIMTGLYYYEQRYFDPNKSTFLRPDPLTEYRYNMTPYHYVMNNPMRFIDPTGLREEEPDTGGIVVLPEVTVTAPAPSTGASSWFWSLFNYFQRGGVHFSDPNGNPNYSNPYRAYYTEYMPDALRLFNMLGGFGKTRVLTGAPYLVMACRKDLK